MAALCWRHVRTRLLALPHRSDAGQAAWPGRPRSKSLEVRSAADVANHFKAPFVTQENHANLALQCLERLVDVCSTIAFLSRGGGTTNYFLVIGAGQQL